MGAASGVMEDFGGATGGPGLPGRVPGAGRVVLVVGCPLPGCTRVQGRLSLLALSPVACRGMNLLSVTAVGSALGRGPVLLHLPPRLLDMIRDKAAHGMPDFVQLQVNLMRQAGVLMYDRMSPQVAKQLAGVTEALVQVTRRAGD